MSRSVLPRQSSSSGGNSPGKHRVVEDCRVEDLTDAGGITAEQGEALLHILAGARLTTA
ncbi:hypothetical protein [Tautonia plasticadhaerens]|uniref:Uncharacterized protein n=1 Tax=Tautonia plasticadhaerens TaxID=2527974 RepID=A0A518H9P1_9BACT|nr:hypothetical protein [Tautonia plasticadhaerens]QDV37517.1 hypothetical protein ElP_54570 [Tautonia plasticadhaerens]